MKKASKIIAIFIFAMSVFVGVGAVEVCFKVEQV